MKMRTLNNMVGAIILVQVILCGGVVYVVYKILTHFGIF